jgi:hypothetical protein
MQTNVDKRQERGADAKVTREGMHVWTKVMECNAECEQLQFCTKCAETPQTNKLWSDADKKN